MGQRRECFSADRERIPQALFLSATVVFYYRQPESPNLPSKPNSQDQNWRLLANLWKHSVRESGWQVLWAASHSVAETVPDICATTCPQLPLSHAENNLFSSLHCTNFVITSPPKRLQGRATGGWQAPLWPEAQSSELKETVWWVERLTGNQYSEAAGPALRWAVCLWASPLPSLAFTWFLCRKRREEQVITKILRAKGFPHLLWQHLPSSKPFPMTVTPQKGGWAFPGCYLPKGSEPWLWFTPHFFPPLPGLLTWFGVETASVWAALAIDGWVIGTEQQVFSACQSGPWICMIAHSETGTCTQSILARVPTRSTEPAPAVSSCLFKQGLPGAGPGCWGETVCYWLRSLDWQPGLRDSCTGCRPQEASSLLGWDIC